jgi:aquaglyceroporin related protein
VEQKEAISPSPGVGGKSDSLVPLYVRGADRHGRLGVMLGVYTAGISGAHLNPAVTLANCVFRKFPWRKLPKYAIAQTLGAFCASGVVYANYKSAIDLYEGGPDLRTVPGYSTNATAGIFCTYPAPFMTRTGMFFSEFIASTILSKSTDAKRLLAW